MAALPTWLTWIWRAAVFFLFCQFILWLSNADIVGMQLLQRLHGTAESLWWWSNFVSLGGCCVLVPVLTLIHLARWAERW